MRRSSMARVLPAGRAGAGGAPLAAPLRSQHFYIATRPHLFARARCWDGHSRPFAGVHNIYTVASVAVVMLRSPKPTSIQEGQTLDAKEIANRRRRRGDDMPHGRTAAEPRRCEHYLAHRCGF